MSFQLGHRQRLADACLDGNNVVHGARLDKHCAFLKQFSRSLPLFSNSPREDMKLSQPLIDKTHIFSLWLRHTCAMLCFSRTRLDKKLIPQVRLTREHFSFLVPASRKQIVSWRRTSVGLPFPMDHVRQKVMLSKTNFSKSRMVFKPKP